MGIIGGGLAWSGANPKTLKWAPYLHISGWLNSEHIAVQEPGAVNEQNNYRV